MMRNAHVARVSCWVLAGIMVWAAMGAARGQESDDREVLNIELPKPMFDGTPRNVWSSNLDPNTGKKRAPFMAPKGLVNVALDKPAIASDELPIIGELDMLTDDDREAPDGSFVEFGPGLQWVQVDLGEPCEIFAVVFWHYHMDARVYRDVIVKVADDPEMVEGVKTLFNNDHDNSSGLGVGKDKEYIETHEGKLVDGNGVKGRYVRLYSNGSTATETNHLIEVAVYGRPAE